MASCKSCGAPIEWALTESGKRIPLDMDVIPGVVTVIGSANDTPLVQVVQGRRTHFSSCPDADHWRVKA